MKIICASCRVEGRSADMGEKAPFDDPTETHGYCSRHTAQLLATLPSHAFPDVDLLMVVRRRDQALYDYLQRRLAGVRGVKVILERRAGDRRRAAYVPSRDRRCLERRLRLGQASSLGYTIVRFRRP
jgi:hypothetical protein